MLVKYLLSIIYNSFVWHPIIYWHNVSIIMRTMLPLLHDWMYYSETCLRQPPVGRFQLTFIERWLLYRGELHILLLFGPQRHLFFERWLPNSVTILDRFHCNIYHTYTSQIHSPLHCYYIMIIGFTLPLPAYYYKELILLLWMI